MSLRPPKNKEKIKFGGIIQHENRNIYDHSHKTGVFFHYFSNL